MIRSFFLAVLALGLIAGQAIADSGPGTKTVKAANDTISGLLKKKADAAKVTTSVREFIDLDELGKQALRDHWDKIDTSQQDEYKKTLRALIEANYVKGMKSNVDYKVEYSGETAKDDGSIVVSTVVKAKRKGRPLKIAVDYTLTKDSKGKLKVVDIATDGVGLVENYRAQFNKIIDKDGVAGLLEKMKKKQAEAEAAATAAASATKS